MTGAVLAGGESRRMGALKEGLRLPDGRPMLAHVLDALKSVCDRVAVVGACRGFAVPDGIIHIPDLRPGEGPLAGLEALLSSGLDDAYLVAGCDQPFLTPDALAQLAAGRGDMPRFFRSEDGTGHDPFPGYFPATLAVDVTAALDRGERSVRRFLRSFPVAWAALPVADAATLRGCNTPDDFAEAVRHWPNRNAVRQYVRDDQMQYERSNTMEKHEMPEPPKKHTRFVKRYPKLGEAWDLIGAAGREGPLDERAARLSGAVAGAQMSGIWQGGGPSSRFAPA